MKNYYLYILFILLSIRLFLVENLNMNKNKMIRKLIRQSSRYAIASRGDKTPLISVLHANYAATYMFALKDLFSDREIENVLGNTHNRIIYEKKILDIQDKATKNVMKYCPQYSGEVDYLTQLAGQS